MMLLPSALPCDNRRPSLPRFAQYTPRSRSASPAPDQFTNIRTTCRALHSLLGVQPQPKASVSTSTITRPSQTATKPTPRPNRVVKRPPLPPRGHKKRRRSVFEADYDAAEVSESENEQENTAPPAPSTPKRPCRRAPMHIPFGLERADFYDLPETPSPASHYVHAYPFSEGSADRMEEDSTPRALTTTKHSTPRQPLQQQQQPGSLTPRPPRRSPRLNAGSAFETSAFNGAAGIFSDVGDGFNGDEGEGWDVEDDRMLVGLVLDKLKLSRRQWDECARQLGADQRSLGARWRFLVDEGQVGLRLRRGGKAKRIDVREIWT